MITDWIIDLWMTLGLWVLSLFGDYNGLPSDITTAVAGVDGFWGSAAAFFGALNHWFPVPLFFGVAAAGLLVEIGIAGISGFRKLKQLLPFQ